METATQTALYVGSGGDHLPSWLDSYHEVRLDIDSRCNPDIVADMRDLGGIGPFDVIYSSHSLEHLYPHDVPVALAEFYRVLSSQGRAVIIVPDLEDIRPTEDVVYVSPAGPITGLDMYYGHRASLKHSPYMAHHTGFTQATLDKALANAGFNPIVRRTDGWQLLAIAVKP